MAQWTQGSGGGGGGGTAPGQMFVGTVKLFNLQKGWGMITCEQTHQIYNKDIFFLKSAVPGGFINSGDRVRFSVKIEAKGPVATELVPLWNSGRGGGGGGGSHSQHGHGNGQNFGGMPNYSMMCGFGGPYMHGFGMHGCGLGPYGPAMGPLGMLGGMTHKYPSANQVCYGTVMSFNDEKGWGFIECEATKRLFNKDVFVMRAVLKGIIVSPGDFVSFKVDMGMKGPQASEIKILPPGSIGTTGKPGNKFNGVVKTFDPDKGWGFIEGEAVQSVFGKDIFIHKRDVGEQTTMAVGDEVSFSVEMDNNGQPQAKNVAKGHVADGVAAIEGHPQGFTDILEANETS